MSEFLCLVLVLPGCLWPRRLEQMQIGPLCLSLVWWPCSCTTAIAGQPQVWYRAGGHQDWARLRIRLLTHSYPSVRREGIYFKGLNAVELNLGFHFPGVDLCKEQKGSSSSAFPLPCMCFSCAFLVLTSVKERSEFFNSCFFRSEHLLMERRFYHMLNVHAVRLQCSSGV